MSGAGGSVPQFGERSEPSSDDYCYRHKSRPSFTLCQRCGRTICAECQTVSAVGVLCGSCVRGTGQSTNARVSRSARTVARRLSDTDRPVVSYTIMIVCVLVFVAQLCGKWLFADAKTGIDPVSGSLWYAAWYSLPTSFEPWRLLTAMTTHLTGFLPHILVNMYALWVFGPHLERIVGRVWFATLYLFSGVGGSLGVMLWVYIAPQPIIALGTATVGASGAIFGVLLATLVVHRSQRLNVTSLAVLIALNLAIGLIPGMAISWQAHLGGMIVGALVMLLLVRFRATPTRVLAVSAVGGALLLLSGAYFIVSPM